MVNQGQASRTTSIDRQDQRDIENAPGTPKKMPARNRMAAGGRGDSGEGISYAKPDRCLEIKLPFCADVIDFFLTGFFVIDTADFRSDGHAFGQVDGGLHIVCFHFVFG